MGLKDTVSDHEAHIITQTGTIEGIQGDDKAEKDLRA